MLYEISKTKNSSYVMGDLNVDMLSMTDTTVTFLNTMSSYYFNHHICSPTKLNTEGKFTLLIDTIYYNTTIDSFSGTIAYVISGHLPMFYSTYIESRL